MKLESYTYQQDKIPSEGKRIIAQYGIDHIIIYQAFNSEISNYAVKNQKFGGNKYSFQRMTWIKPGFMWMMYRSGWAKKENQERILSIKIKKSGFYEILTKAVLSTFDSEIYESHEMWKELLKKSEVRLQWDPDHDPKGNKLARKAIQIGLRGEILRKFNEEYIISIDDITNFVSSEFNNIDSELKVPFERELTLNGLNNNYGELIKKIDVDWSPWNIFIEYKIISDDHLRNLTELFNDLKSEKEKNDFNTNEERWQRYFKSNYWKAQADDWPWLIDCFKSGEYKFISCSQTSIETGKIILETWSAPYGGLDPFRYLIKGFGFEIIDEWD